MAVEIDKERLYRRMTSEQIAAHEDWVRRFKETAAYEEAKKVIAAKARMAELRAMGDLQLVHEVLACCTAVDDVEQVKNALQMLVDGGFERAAR